MWFILNGNELHMGYCKDQSLILYYFFYTLITLRTLKNISKSVHFSDDTVVVIMNKNRMNFQNKINIVFDKLNKWFTANQLALNYKKTKFILSLTLVIQIIWIC